MPTAEVSSSGNLGTTSPSNRCRCLLLPVNCQNGAEISSAHAALCGKFHFIFTNDMTKNMTTLPNDALNIQDEVDT